MKRAALAFALGSIATGAAHAQTSAVRVELTWSAPAGCPAQADVEAEIARRLGRALGGDGAQLRASAEVETIEQGFRLSLSTELDGESGTRLLEAPRCDELASAASVIVALLADPHADATPAAKPPAPPAPPPKPAAQPTRAESVDRDEETIEVEEPSVRSPPIVVRASLRAELFADVGTMPKLGLGPALSVGVRLDRSALELTGSYLPPNDVDSGGRTLGSVQLWSAAFGACHAFGRATALGPCIRAEYGRMSGKGSDVLRKPGGSSGKFAALWLGLRLDVALLRAPELLFYAELDAGLPLARTLFTVQGVEHTHEPAAVLGRVRAGAELRF